MDSFETPEPEAFEIALCTAADRAEQAQLFNACFKKTLEVPALTWRYDQNPHGSAVSLVARPVSGPGAGGPGVSGYACSPRRALAHGDESSLAPVGQTGDVMTHPEWRKRGIFSQLDKRAMEETARLGWPLVFGLPNRRSAHIFLELGWEEVGKIRPWTFVLKVTPESKAVRRVDGRLKVLGMGRALAKGRAARTRLRRESEGRFGVRRIAKFPPEVEELSRQVEKNFAFMVRRDAAYLNWRFIDNTAKRHTPLGVYTREGQLVAYVVIQAPQEGEVVGYLVDVLAQDDTALAQAMEAGIAQLYASGAELVQATAVDGSWWQARLKQTAFQAPREENHLIVILFSHQADHPLTRAARQAKGWYLTDGDRDDETMG